MKTSWVFTGQGSQTSGMGLFLKSLSEDIYSEYTSRASDALGFSMDSLLTVADAAEITATENAQPAILTYSIIALKAAILEGKITHSPVMVAGHSLGEYTALVASGALSFEDGIKIVRKRGEAMSKSGGGGMVAVIGGSIHKLEEMAEYYPGILEVANDNCTGQVVMSGDPGGVKFCLNNYRNFGAKRAIELPVSAPFHSSIMASARCELACALDGATIKTPSCDVIHNTTVGPSNNIKNALLDQLSGKVRWRETIAKLVASSDHIIEFGPKPVLTAMVKKESKESNPTYYKDLLKK